MENTYNILKAPYDNQQLIDLKTEHLEQTGNLNANITVEGVVIVQLDEMIDNDPEAFIDILCKKLLESCLMQGITYSVIGVNDDESILMHLCAEIDPNDIEDDEERE